MYENLNETIEKIINVEKNDIGNENANMSAASPAGQMMKFASEVSKEYALNNLVSKKFADAHRKGLIHIHDLDFYPTKTTTCLQYDLEDLFEKGFLTRHGHIREAKSISSYATLATIIFQTNQNEQHGGQAIPAFDFYMAKGVLKSFRKHLRDRICAYKELRDGANTGNGYRQLSLEWISDLADSIKPSSIERKKLSEQFEMSETEMNKLLKEAYSDTESETYQAMEGFLHNLNTMHSRGGNQVVFSSVNYGTDTSEEGRMVVREILKATQKGLGRGETPIFPIQIFKVKEGINFSDEDYAKGSTEFDELIEDIRKGNTENMFKTPNFDLLMLACETTSKRLFPNFVFLDTEFNSHEKWSALDPRRYRYEVATMGCRTRVFENLNGEKSSLGRGNLSFTSINFPRLAIEARKEAGNLVFSDESRRQEFLAERFKEKVKETAYMVAEQLLERFEFQKTALAKQFPFMAQNNLWKGLGEKNSDEEVGDAINTGSLSIGFVGGANAMYALFGQEHSESQLAYDTLYEAVLEMNDVANEYAKKHHLNFSVLATPAESLAGRFLRIDRGKYGTIENVTDRDYYVNSFHVDVKHNISIFDKIKKEAPFHKITRGGHITYIELDGEARKNLPVLLKIVKAMKDAQIGYGSINHPVDRCRKCGLETIIYDACPICGSHDISRIRRITGYLVGDLDSWNSAKRAEEHDRVKHGIK